jgi:hypothetical protein
MQLFEHFFRPGIVVLVKLHRVPAVLSPVLPVLNQGINRDLSLAKLRCSVEDFLLAVVTLSTLPMTVGPFREQRCFTVSVRYAEITRKLRYG